MLSLKPVVDLLKVKPDGFDGPWFRKIGGAAEYAQALSDKLPLPVAWVIRAADKSNSIGDGATDDIVAFDVVIAIENMRTQNTFETDEKLRAYREAVLSMLLGYELGGSVKPMTFEGGQVVDYSDGELYWRDRYQIAQMIVNYQPDPVSAQNHNFTMDKNS